MLLLWSFLCHSPPRALRGVLSKATARPEVAQGFSTSTRCRPKHPFCWGSFSGRALSLRSKVRLEGKRRSHLAQRPSFEVLQHDQVLHTLVQQVGTTLKRWNKSLTVEPDALEKIVAEGYSLAYGARFLKRVIDDRIKLPISQRWKETNAFRAVVRGDTIAVEVVGPRLIASADPDAIAV
jgi:hypothetical protein